MKDGMVRDGNLLAVGNKGVHFEAVRENQKKVHFRPKAEKQHFRTKATSLTHKKFVWSYSLLKKLDSEISVEYVTSVQVG
jgi:hypothetical protein